MSTKEIKNGDIYYNAVDKQFIVFSSRNKKIDSGFSSILTMSGKIEPLSDYTVTLDEINEDNNNKWKLVGNLTDIFRKVLNEH